jgi:hypothetical protein
MLKILKLDNLSKYEQAFLSDEKKEHFFTDKDKDS